MIRQDDDPVAKSPAIGLGRLCIRRITRIRRLVAMESPELVG